MSRITFGSLSLNYSAGKSFIQVLGIFRPFIGALFGIICYTILSGKFFPISLPTDPSVLLYFYSGVGWIAGFSERWAQDMLIDSSKKILPFGKNENPKIQAKEAMDQQSA